MIHDHQKFVKKIGIRDFQRNVYKNLPAINNSIVITNRGQASYFVTACSMEEVKNENGG